MELWFKFDTELQKAQDFDSMTLRLDGSLMFKKQGEIQAIYYDNTKAMYDNISKYADCGMVILDGKTHEIVETEKIKVMNNIMQNKVEHKFNISAMQCFESLGYLPLENDENTLGFIRELRHNNYAQEYLKVVFNKQEKEYSVYTLIVNKDDDTRYTSIYNIDYHLHKAIQKQIEELGWYE